MLNAGTATSFHAAAGWVLAVCVGCRVLVAVGWAAATYGTERADREGRPNGRTNKAKCRSARRRRTSYVEQSPAHSNQHTAQEPDTHRKNNPAHGASVSS